MADQRQGVGMTSRHTSRYFHPRRVIVTGLRQNGAGCPRRIVLERGCRPVIRHRIGTMHLVPEAQCSRTTWNRKGLANSAIAISRRRSTRLTRVAPTVRRRTNRGRTGRRPTRECSRLKTTIGDATTACRCHCYRHGGAMCGTAFNTRDSDSIVPCGYR